MSNDFYPDGDSVHDDSEFFLMDEESRRRSEEAQAAQDAINRYANAMIAKDKNRCRDDDSDSGWLYGAGERQTYSQLTARLFLFIIDSS